MTEAQNQSVQVTETVNEKQKLTVQMPNVAGPSTAPTPQPTTTTGTIPQDIATMSEHDLISYINPSCFE